ncbi:abkC [Symbiodinium sp. CCMP2592]|nr:abkC [Symbiodinium sp. CCMP2592]
MDAAGVEAGPPAAAPAAPPARPRRRRWWFLAVVFVVFFIILLSPLHRRCVYLFVAWLPAVPAYALGCYGPVVGAFKRSGPVFIKLAQWASTRRDVIPGELCDAMGTLHENVPTTMSRTDLDSSQREDQLDLDLDLLRWFAGWVTWWKPELTWMALEGAVDNFGEYMMQQVNLNIEASNMKRFAQNFASNGNILVPPVYAATDSVLVMGIAEGTGQGMKDNFMHGDLHPGNLFIKFEDDGSPTVTLIDVGISIAIENALGRMIKELGQMLLGVLGLGQSSPA